MAEIIRKYLRRLIVWALAAEPAPPHDPSELDDYAANHRG